MHSKSKVNDKTDTEKRCLLLLITTQRSGSTWLFDLLRTLDGIKFECSVDNWKMLDLNGRRYPRDLSSKSENSVYMERIEVRPGVYEFIAPRSKVEVERNGTVYLLEKFHPHFASFRFRKFFRKLKKEKLGEVRVIVHVRDPITSIFSFVNYQKRRNWYRKYEGSKIIDLFHKDLLFIEKVICHFSPESLFFSTFEDMNKNLNSYLMSLGEFLWPGFRQNNTSSSLCRYLVERNQKNGLFVNSCEERAMDVEKLYDI